MSAGPVGTASPPAGGRVRLRLRVDGVVQGVGFRPFVHLLATRLELAGFVGNDAAGVFAEVEGPVAACSAFRIAVAAEAPPPAVVERVDTESLPVTGAAGFTIVPSPLGGTPDALVAPDTATCTDCLAEAADPANRRYRYPFTNCARCGPRLTIVTGVPYDRPRTTMAGFTLCTQCQREYDDPTDRRFHAQPLCCPACGPTLRLINPAGVALPGDPVLAAAGLLRAGQIVAIKGLGGYHLATDAGNEAAVAALRHRKHREDRPFALLVADLDAAQAVCQVDPTEETLLTSPRRPIVLLRRRTDPSAVTVAAAVAPGNGWLGLMLPYSVLHHLLVQAVGAPVVLTSGNVSDEPIAYDDDDARSRLSAIADAFLLHDRPIHIRVDDSVVRAVRGRELPIRRSRGYAPAPLRLAHAAPRPVLGVGAMQKNTFCLARGGRTFPSHHIGDLGNLATLQAFTACIEHYERLFDVHPEVIAHDLHPDYLSTSYALDRADANGLDAVAVQHHHAHIASCLAEHRVDGPVIGVAFDGTGLGDDGTIWGGELLLADLAGYRRLGHLATVPLPGGEAAVREPWRMAAAWLDAAYPEGAPDLPLPRRQRERWDAVVSVARSGVHAPLTSSVGRLFDAVGALVVGRDAVSYEGQAAVELEQAVDRDTTGGYEMGSERDSGLLVLRGSDLLRGVVEDLTAGVEAAVVAARFHHGLGRAVVEAAGRLAADHGLDTVAISGGCFQNLLIVEEISAGLETAGLRVLVPSGVPPNDGGISVGQVAVAATRDRLTAARAG